MECQNPRARVFTEQLINYRAIGSISCASDSGPTPTNSDQVIHRVVQPATGRYPLSTRYWQQPALLLQLPSAGRASEVSGASDGTRGVAVMLKRASRWSRCARHPLPAAGGGRNHRVRCKCVSFVRFAISLRVGLNTLVPHEALFGAYWQASFDLNMKINYLSLFHRCHCKQKLR